MFTKGQASFSNWCWQMALWLSRTYGSVAKIFIEAFPTKNW